MNYSGNTILWYIFILLISSNLIAQNTDVDIHFKDTTALRKAIKLTILELNQTKKADQDKVNAILKSSLLLKDTTSFFQFCEKMYKYHSTNGLNEEGILFLKESQKILGTDNTTYGELNNYLGNHHLDLNFLIDALEYYFKSVKWYEKYDEENTTVPLGNVAEIYFINEDYHNSLKYNRLALSYSLKLTNLDDKRYNLVYDYFRIGAIHHKLQNNSEAEKYFTKSLEVAREQKDDYLFLIALKKALEFYDEIRKNEVCEALIAEGNTLLNDSTINQSAYAGYLVLAKAHYYLNSCQLHKAIHPKNIQFENPANRSKILAYSVDYYVAHNDIEKALEFYKKIINENRNVERKKWEGVFSSIEANYNNNKLKKKHKELYIDIEEEKRNNLIILFLLLFIGCFLILQLINNKRFKKVNQLLQIKKQELQSSNSDLERFSHIASHDLKTPLRNIVSFTNLLEKELESYKNENVHEYLLFIKNSGLRLNDLIESTLEYSRLSNKEKAKKMEEIDLNVLLSDLEYSISKLIKERNAKIIKLNHLPNIKAHKTSMFLLFQNLVENGIKYNTSNMPTIKISTKTNKAFFSIYISDNGIGISKEHFDQIFTMFTRLHSQNEYKGSGLGLSICKKIVNQINGDLHIKSIVGEGSVFEIKLPNYLIFSKN